MSAPVNTSHHGVMVQKKGREGSQEGQDECSGLVAG